MSLTTFFELFSTLSARWSIFSHPKIKFLFSYVLALFINLGAVAVILPIMAKLSAILKPECVNTLEFLLLLEKKVTGDIDSTINEHHLFCNHSPGFEKFSILAVNNNDFTLTLMESFSINRDHLPLDAFGTFYHMIAVYCSDYCPLILPRYCFIKWMVFYS